ncbi:23067_t:CDS:2, partial [Racocetra persica]
MLLLLYSITVKITLIILYFVKNWTAPVKDFKKDCEIKVDIKIKQINQFSTRDRAIYNNNHQEKHHRNMDDDKKKLNTDVEIFSEETTYIDESLFQKNKEKAITKHSFKNASQGNDEKKTIHDDI